MLRPSPLSLTFQTPSFGSATFRDTGQHRRAFPFMLPVCTSSSVLGHDGFVLAQPMDSCLPPGQCGSLRKNPPPIEAAHTSPVPDLDIYGLLCFFAQGRRVLPFPENTGSRCPLLCYSTRHHVSNGEAHEGTTSPLLLPHFSRHLLPLEF
jgi:hypothetical protein